VNRHPLLRYRVLSDLPSYPNDAAQREAAAGPPGVRSDYASWGRRVGAYLLDALVIAVPFIVIIVIALLAGDPEEDDGTWGIIGIAYLLTIVAPFIYFTVMHGRESGQTLGKRWVGIRVADDSTGRSIGYGRAFGRYAITFVFWLIVIPAILDYLWPLWDRKKQALHDKVVGSVVVRV
jgi:uncharacterized RDD family membrane protein YckC